MKSVKVIGDGESGFFGWLRYAFGFARGSGGPQIEKNVCYHTIEPFGPVSHGNDSTLIQIGMKQGSLRPSHWHRVNNTLNIFYEYTEDLN